MAVHNHPGTMTGGTTPICDDCGVSLCWDISRTEYLEAKAFWDAWRCQDCHGTRLSACGWRSRNGREALPAEVETLVAAFADLHGDLDTPEGCRDRSESVSDEFADLLDAAGIRAKVVAIAEVDGVPHHVVETDHFTIDWTAAQHDEAAPCPLVFRTTLGWPIEPATAVSLEEMLELLTPAQAERLKSILSAS